MVAQALPRSHTADVRLVTEFRGAVARLWDEGVGEVVISGPAGTGKTKGILDWIHKRCSTERLRVLILRKVEESLKSSALVTFQEEVLCDFDGQRSRIDGVQFFGGNKIRPAQFTYPATGSVIVCGGLNNATKVKSSRWDIVFVNEVNELSLDDWEMITGRTDRPTLVADPPPSLVLGDCNPDAPTHWIKQREAEGSLHVWESRHEDNPAMWDRFLSQWTPSGERYLARLNKLTGVRKQRMRDGKWVAAAGQVYDAFDAAVHVVDAAEIDLAAYRRRIGSVDWGYTKPGVLQVWGVDGDERMAMLREVYRARKTVTGWWLPQAQALTREFDVEVWVCDPSEPAYIQEFRDGGLNAVAAKNDILPGITAVQERLAPEGDGRVRLVIVRDAMNDVDHDLLTDKQPISTLQEIGSYVWPQDAGGRVVKDRPVDAYNHGCDAWRYATMHVDGGPPGWSDLDTGDLYAQLRAAGVG